MSDNSDALKLGLSLMVFGGAFLWSCLKKKKKARRFEDFKHIKISSAPQGHVELSGFAWTENFIPGTLGAGAAYLSWQLEKLVDRGKNSSWEIVAKGSKPDGFYLNDDTGSVWVNMHNAELEAKLRYYQWGKITEQEKSVFMSWMGKYYVDGFPPVGGIFGSKFRMGVRELAPGCPVVALGHLSSSAKRKKGAVLSGFSEFKEKYKKFLSNPAYRMSMLDTDQNGEISEDEHRMGYVYSANTVARKLQIQELKREEEIALLGELSSGPHETLVVADTHEFYLLGRLRRWTSVGIVGGALLIAAGVCVLCYEFVFLK